MNIEKLSLNDTNCNKNKTTEILLNGDIMKNKDKKDASVAVEYGKENLRKILEDYLIQKFIETLEKEQE